LLRFQSDPDTLEVAEDVGRVARTFASDSSAGLNLIFWREEQRAVAELMVDLGTIEPIPTVTGFATFRKRYREDLRRETPEDLALWLGRFAQDVQVPTIAQNHRLRELEENLDVLVKALERGRATNHTP
jgi:hypothetical protein